ncbi:MAG: M23 family metallopeptidase [Chlorobi bacterium]|nr:M23 family metallopeptidase [Chlorobiota bacterium]
MRVINGTVSTEEIKRMKVWPVPESFSKEIPKKGTGGSFWEDRGDRRHCGVDIYAPVGAQVVAVESGMVVDKGVFTSPEQFSNWKTTNYVIIKTSQKVLVKYAELGETFVNIGDYVSENQLLGFIGSVVDKNEITYSDPFYVQELADNDTISMLHIECYKAPVTQVQPYLAGNYFGERRPISLLDPGLYLRGVAKTAPAKSEMG